MSVTFDSAHRAGVSASVGHPETTAGCASQAAVGVGDLGAVLVAMQTVVRDLQVNDKSQQIQTERSEKQKAFQKRIKQLDKAIKDERAGDGFLGLGKVIDAIVELVVVAVGVVASVYTGGASLALVGAALTLFGDDIAGVLAEAGILPDEAVPLVSAALQIIGSVLMANAGGAAGAANTATGASSAASTASAANTAATTVGTAEEVRQLVDTLQAIEQAVTAVGAGGAAGCKMVGAHFEHEAELHNIEADRQGNAMERAQDVADEHVEQIKNLMEQFRRMVELAIETQRAKDEALAFAMNPQSHTKGPRS